MTFIELAKERQRVLGAKYTLLECGKCGYVMNHPFRGELHGDDVLHEKNCNDFKYREINAATKRNFYLDIAEELADVWVIANEATKRMDIDPWCRSYLKTIMQRANHDGEEALELSFKYGHDDIPVERVLPLA